MTQHRPTSADANETSTLLVSLVLGDASDEQIGRLNELLQGDVELRRRAAQFFEEETVLRHQFQMLGRVGNYHNSSPDELLDATTRTIPATEACSGATVWRARRATPFFIVASLFAMLVVGALSITRPWKINGSRPIAGNLEPGQVGIRPERDHPASPRSAVLPLAASMLPRVTRVSWAGPQFASNVEAEPLASVMHAGIVPFTSAFGRPAQGYMVHLPPNAQLDLVVAADADGENALAVIEFDDDGRPTGRRISYGNSAGESTLASRPSSQMPTMTKYGPLGIWTDRNNTSRSKFYFFTSVHKLLNRSADDAWHVSRLAVLLEESGLVHIGWDDSGMMRGDDRDYVHIPDDDFDDLSATIRITQSEQESPQKISEVRVLPEFEGSQSAENEPSAGREQAGFSFSVAPGQTLVIKGVYRASTPISLMVVDKKTGRVHWTCKRLSPRSTNLGVCAIENNSLEPQEYLLVSQHKIVNDDKSESWRQSNHTLLFQQEMFTTVAFENGQVAPEVNQVKVDPIFNQVKVDILTIGNL